MHWFVNRIYGYTAQGILKSSLVALFLLVLSLSAIAQDCTKFHKKYCLSYKEQGYEPTEESRSFTLTKGDFASQNVFFNNGQDYHINFSVDDIFANQLYIQIIDVSTDEVLYDNKEDNMSLNMEFSAIKDTDAKIIFETTTPTYKNERNPIKGCIGLLIETRPTPPTGFRK